jgi:hypothetical protein
MSGAEHQAYLTDYSQNYFILCNFAEFPAGF